MTTPSEAEVRLLAEALHATHCGCGQYTDEELEEKAPAILATGLHVVTDEERRLLAVGRAVDWFDLLSLIEPAAESIENLSDRQSIVDDARLIREHCWAAQAAIDAALEDPQP